MGVYKYNLNGRVESIFIGTLEDLKKEDEVVTNCKDLEEFMEENPDYFGNDAFYFWVNNDKIGKLYEDVVGVEWKYLSEVSKEFLLSDCSEFNGYINFFEGLYIKGYVENGKPAINNNAKVELKNTVYL